MVDAKKAALILAAISLIAALSAAALFLNMVRQAEENLGSSAAVIVAAREIPSMTTIKEDMVTLMKVPRRLAMSTTFGSVEDVCGKTTVTALSPNEILTAGLLLENLPIPANSRVVKLRSPLAVFDDDFKYGDRVDIVASYKSGEDDLSETIFRNVSVAGFTKSDDGESAVLGVVIDNSELEKIIWVLNYGKEVRVVKAVP